MNKHPSNLSSLPPPYREFARDLRATIPPDRLMSDPLRTLAHGSDASFYRLIPKLVIKAAGEADITTILQTANRYGLPVTFRAAGTSLSGQAITDSVLVLTGDSWTEHEILDGGKRIRLQPGIVGAGANRALRPYGRKIGPDPASIDAAMIGGIAANNASGMCCGVAQNSYQTVSGMRVIFHDGALLDTTDEDSRARFRQSHGELLNALTALGARVLENAPLAARIRHKFKIKNTTGYSLNALVDYEDPFDIIEHLMIGSEGTLGFIAEIVYDTVEEHAHKASALAVFRTMRDACTAAALLREQPVAAVELMDRTALRSVENKAGIPDYLRTLPEGAATLLIETRAGEPGTLTMNIACVTRALRETALERPLAFTDKVKAYTALWNIRKGLFPAVGAIRKTGTTVIIEDVAFPIERLADATVELREIMGRLGYDAAIIFGHALEGNLHFVFTQDFGDPAEVARYREFMDAVTTMVVERYDGSLKAEHGTGRNMAPFVEMEWGQDAYALMKEIKEIFDPHDLLNPGVILNADPDIHVKNLKPLPATHDIVDTCIECGFCEPVCPSRHVTLTPRQRIVAQREISRLRRRKDNGARLEALEHDYRYHGQETCAADGLCEMACPVDINTGDLTKALRQVEVEGTRAEKRARWMAEHFAAVTRGVRTGLGVADAFHAILGGRIMTGLMSTLRRFSGDRIPLWNTCMPRPVKGGPTARSEPVGQAAPAAPEAEGAVAAPRTSRKRLVYFPSCVARTMGPARGDDGDEPLWLVAHRIFETAGYEVIYPEAMQHLCCGMPFTSKGFARVGDDKARELETALRRASEDGALPVVCDTSPCLYRMRQVFDPAMKLYEPVEFLHDVLLDHLDIRQTPATVAVHVTCSAQKMALDEKFLAVARRCAAEVIAPEGIGCCGFAGDRGFSFPELNASALGTLKAEIPENCKTGYSNSRTCEIGLSLHSGIPYKSILYLVDQCLGR